MSLKYEPASPTFRYVWHEIETDGELTTGALNLFFS